MSNVAVRVNLTWEYLGSVTLDQAGRLLFPKASASPGIYRFSLRVNGIDEVYVGEADQLARRFQHYRTPGPSQHTNIRLNARMIEVLAGGGSIAVSSAARNVTIGIQDAVREAALTLKQERVLVEHAALVAEAQSGANILNA